jgi:hypothetical protein
MQEAQPIHRLRHGRPLEELDERADREGEDVGVKFTAWGASLDRFYSGSSDGTVKVWNVRATRPLVRNLLEVPGPVVCGAFSSDHARLLIGDATGRIFLLSVDEEEGLQQQQSGIYRLTLPNGRVRNVRPPKSIKLHADIPAPRDEYSLTPQELAHRYLERQQLLLHHDPTVGVVQGPNYVETGLFNRVFHVGDDPSHLLRSVYNSVQQEQLKRNYSQQRRYYPLRPPNDTDGLHTAEIVERNRRQDSLLESEVLALLRRHAVEDPADVDARDLARDLCNACDDFVFLEEEEDHNVREYV